MPLELDATQREELARFPPALLALLDAEVAAGNAIADLRHGFPAPPIGACVLLERQVTTRPRADGDGLTHRPRQSSSCSGEFTDASRIYFVLEPPEPPPPEPDMDAIRAALAPRPRAELPAPAPSQPARSAQPSPAIFPPSRGDFGRTDLPQGFEFELEFRDARTPQELHAAMEQRLVIPFEASSDGDTLGWRAEAMVVGARYRFTLRFLAALTDSNHYAIRIEGSWEGSNPANDDYYRKTSRSWVDLWTRDFAAVASPSGTDVSRARYRELAEEAQRANAALDSIEAIQAAIVTGMKCFGRYARSHKEGGTHIVWRGDVYMRTDHGDDPAIETYATDAEFLTMLRGFCDLEIRRWAGANVVDETDAWRLVLRRMTFD